MPLKLLIAVGEATSGAEDIPASVRALIDAVDDILVMSPALPGRLDWLASATDKAREQADERLHAVLGQLEQIGAQAHGAVGADDPLVAFDDAVRQFAPDHILVGLRSEDRAGWQEKGLLDEIVHRFGLPTTVFSFPDDRG